MFKTRLRKLALTGGVVWLIGAAATVTATLNDIISPAVGLSLIFDAVIVLSVALVFLTIRKKTLADPGKLQQLVESENRLRALLHEVAEERGKLTELALSSVEEAKGVIAEERVELLMRLAAVDSQLKAIESQVSRAGEAGEAAGDAVAKLRSDLSRSMAQAVRSEGARSLTKLNGRLFAMIEAQADLRGLLRPRAPMPLLGGWALDADVMHLIVRLMWDRRPGLVVECGSGSSTVWLGYLVERLGAGRVVAIEHDRQFFEQTKDLVEAHDLQNVVEVRHAPLQAWPGDDGNEYQWYQPAAFDDLKDINLLLVDGPPMVTCQQARYPAGPLLLPRCAENAMVVLDDANRSSEAEVSDRWVAQWPSLERTVVANGRAHLFQHRSSVTDE